MQEQHRRPRVRKGRDLERLVLAHAVRWHLELRWHLEDKILINQTSN